MPESERGNYEWYLAGYDFLVARWNHICRADCDLGYLPEILDRVRLMMEDAWDIESGNRERRIAPEVNRGD